MTLLNIFHSGGIWVLLLLPLIGFVVFFRQSLKASKSGTWIGGGNGKPLQDGGGNMPFYKTGVFYFSLLFLVAFGILLWWIIVDYKGV